MSESILSRKLKLAGVVSIPCALLAASAIGAGASPPNDLQAAKAASARYHSVEQAGKDGYVPASPCTSSPGGAMGMHYVNPQLAGDALVNPQRPELLLYLPDQGGELELVGVEYFVASADQQPPIDDADRPQLFGRGFDGPMEGHGPGMPYHYDLHVWFWADNPSGTFSAFNPSISCPD